MTELQGDGGRSRSERTKGRDERQRMMERMTTVKTAATRSGSEHLNASRNKHAGDEEAEKKKKAVSVLSLAISGWSKRRFSVQMVRNA